MPLNSTPHSPIALIGLGCRYPDARSPKELWENVLARRQSFRRMPDERLPLSEYGDADKRAPDKTYGKRAAVIDGFHFDWARRRIPKQVFEQTDITHWLALDVALQALTDAGYEPKELPRDRTGVVIGNTLTGEQQRSHLLRGRWPFVRKTIRAAGIKKGLDGATLEELVAETEKIYKSFFPAPNEDTLAGALANTIAGRICNYMDLRGGGYTVDGACSSSLLSVATASNALCAGDIDVALAGGVDVSLDAFELVGFAKVGALSDSEMKVYDRAGNGFLPGEGCGFIVMKRLADAERDGDYVYAVLNGWGISSDGKGGITAPTVEGQGLALRRAYDRAGYSAHQLDFVEGHGTGTAVGDPVELAAISNTIESFGEAEPHGCGVTSFKSLVGHTKAAAGVGGLLKAVAAVNRRVIPPTAGCDEPHEVFNDKAKNLYPVRTGTCHEPSRILTAGVSAMGFGGINSHVTLTSGGAPSGDLAPALDERALLASKQDTELFVLAEASTDSLSHRVSELLEIATGMSIGEMPDLAVDLARRINQSAPVRAAIVASGPEDLHKRLEQLLAAAAKAPAKDEAYKFSTPDRRLILTVGASTPRIGFLFPGQGSQRLNMAGVLVERFGWARELVSNADAWLQEVGVAPVSPFIFRDTERDLSGEQQKQWMQALTQTEVAQPAICLASLLWLRFLKQLGLKPTAVGGHSLGELPAFCAAGALDEKSVLQLAALRGKLMGEVPVEGSMASLVCKPDEARALLARIDGYVVIANINSASQTVVSGDRAAIAATVALATKNGIRARELPVSAAFHSAHFAETVNALRQTPVLRGTGTPTEARLYSTMTGTVLEGEIDLADHFGEQVVKPVNFQAVARLATSECDLLVEVGPGSVLSGLSNETAGIGGTVCLPVESKAGYDRDLNVAVAHLFTQGVPLDLDKLWDRRLIRRFKSTAQLSFFVNPCEKPMLDADLEASTYAEGLYRADAEGSSHLESHIRALLPERAPAGMQDTGQAGGSSRSQLVNARAVILDVLHKLTGFPIDTLTDDLRLVDDLHLDSIKTVELVSDAAERLGISEAFDAAQFSEVALGELIERMELLEADPAQGGGKSGEEPARAERRDEADNPWVANYAVHWEEERLPPSMDANPLRQGRTLVMAIDTNDVFVKKLVQDLIEKGCDVHARKTADGSDGGTPFDHLLVVYSDTSVPSAIEELSRVVELLARAARELPSTSVESGQPSCLAWIRARAGDAKRTPHFDWSADAFAATVHLERRKLRVRSLEFAEANRQGACIADALLREVADEQPFVSVRYDSDGRRLVGTPRLQQRASYAPRETSIESDDVVLVTGGAKGITAQCALALARETGATMVLVGSSRAPDAETHSPGADEIRETLSKFEAEGIQSEYRQCNLALREDVERLVAAVREDFGSINVVIHGAGLNRPRRAEEPDFYEVIDEIGPKLSGALHLFEALEDAPPKMFVALTSVIGVVGMPHNAWYAFANQSLDRSLGQFAARHPSVEAVSLAYSIWDEVGMGAKLGSIERLGKLGIDAIPVKDGVAHFVELLTHDPGAREVIVTGSLGGVDTWRPVMPKLPRAHRFIDQILTLEPGRELVCRTTLDLERDPYVRDHVYEGSHLLPAVFGLEAMAEAVAYVTGRAELTFPLTIEKVELDRPLIVHPDRGLQIEIRARVDESEVGVGQHVHAEIRSKQTGFEQSHFAARFDLGAPTAPAKSEGEIETEALPIEPKKHLYGSIRFQDGSVLFQGPRFQRIDELYTLDSKHCRFAATQGFAGEQENWLLGDPYFRDALLQSLQLCVVPDQCLPVRIDRWEIVDCTATQASKRLCEAVIEGKEDDTYIGTISSVSAEGSPIETLVGYRARMLVQRLDWPAAEELALRGAPPVTGLRSRDGADDARARVNAFQTWDGGVFYRDVPDYGHEGQTAFFSRFPLTAQDASSPSGSLNPAIYFRWAGKLRETGGINTDGVYQGLLAMLGSNDVMSATNECETRILKVPRRNDLIEGRYWMEYVNKGDAGNLFEWWRIPFPDGVPELLAWTRMRTSAVKAIRHGVIAATEWPDFLYRFLRVMGDDAIEPTKGPPLDLDLGACLFAKAPGPKPGVLLSEQTFSTSQEDANVVGNIYFANYASWQGRVADRFFHSAAPHYFEDRGARGELHRPETSISQLRDAMPFDEIRVEMRLDELYERGARLSFNFLREGSEGLVKIAAGRNLVSWALIERGATPNILDWPSELREAMLRQVDERRVVLKKYA